MLSRIIDAHKDTTLSRQDLTLSRSINPECDCDPKDMQVADFQTLKGRFDVSLDRLRRMRIVEALIKFIPQEQKAKRLAQFSEAYQATLAILREMKERSWKLSEKLSYDRVKKLSLGDLREVEIGLAILRLMSAAETSWAEHFSQRSIQRLNTVVDKTGLSAKTVTFPVLKFESTPIQSPVELKHLGFSCC